PQALRAHHETLLRLGAALKQIDAPFGPLGMDSLRVATTAITGDDATHQAVEAQLTALATAPDALAGEIPQGLAQAEVGGVALGEGQAKELIDQAAALAGQAATVG